MLIPKGKQLRIRHDNQSITGDIPLVLEEDITLSLSSNFSPLFGGGDTKALNVIGSLAREFTMGKIAFSGQFQQLGFQMWGGTDPIAFTATLGFYMGSTDANNARIEVYEPMIKLASLPLPEEGRFGNLIGPGPAITTILGGLLGKITENTEQRLISLEIGRILRIGSIIVKRAEPTFSNETDEFGYPISGKIQLDINSLFTATVEMLTDRNFQKAEKSSKTVKKGLSREFYEAFEK